MRFVRALTRDRLGNYVDTFVLAMRNLGPMRLAIMGVVVLGLIGFLVFFGTKLSTPSMTTLYNELAQSDAAGIVQELESRNIPFKISQNGTQIAVPAERVMQLRLELAQQGLPSGGSVGYELFDDTDTSALRTLCRTLTWSAPLRRVSTYHKLHRYR